MCTTKYKEKEGISQKISQKFTHIAYMIEFNSEAYKIRGTRSEKRTWICSYVWNLTRNTRQRFEGFSNEFRWIYSKRCFTGVSWDLRHYERIGLPRNKNAQLPSALLAGNKYVLIFDHSIRLKHWLSHHGKNHRRKCVHHRIFQSHYLRDSSYR